MKRALILVALSLFVCSTAIAFQGGGGEATKKGASKKTVVTKKKTSGTKAANTTTPTTPAGTRPAPKSQESRVDVLAQLRNSLVIIPAGEFMMGSTNGWPTEQPVHSVSISQPFYMGKYEVTQAQWLAVMGGNPSYFKNCDNCPVEQVSWDDAQQFLAKLNARNDGYSYRLPSEAEWEYACRAGTTGNYAGDLETMAWYGNNSGRAWLDASAIMSSEWAAHSGNYYKRIRENGAKTHPVGSKQPNAWGLYDMYGNVWEWCQDWYHDTYDGAPVDGSAWERVGEQKDRVERGGSWLYNGYNTWRSADRNKNSSDVRSDGLGFRVVAVREVAISGLLSVSADNTTPASKTTPTNSAATGKPPTHDAPLHFNTWSYGPGGGEGVDIQFISCKIRPDRITLSFSVRSGNHKALLLYAARNLKEPLEPDCEALYILDDNGQKFYSTSGWRGGRQAQFNSCAT